MKFTFSIACTFLFFFLVYIPINAQVGIGTTSPLEGTSLQVEGDDQGVLINRVSLLGKDDTTTVSLLGLSQEGLLVYNINTVDAGGNSVYPGFYYWSGTNWQSVKENRCRKS